MNELCRAHNNTKIVQDYHDISTWVRRKHMAHEYAPTKSDKKKLKNARTLQARFEQPYVVTEGNYLSRDSRVIVHTINMKLEGRPSGGTMDGSIAGPIQVSDWEMQYSGLSLRLT